MGSGCPPRLFYHSLVICWTPCFLVLCKCFGGRNCMWASTVWPEPGTDPANQQALCKYVFCRALSWGQGKQWREKGNRSLSIVAHKAVGWKLEMGSQKGPLRQSQAGSDTCPTLTGQGYPESPVKSPYWNIKALGWVDQKHNIMAMPVMAPLHCSQHLWCQLVFSLITSEK